jgi:hypothetical protein
VTHPVSTRILDALAALLQAANTGAFTVDVDRDNEAEPYGVEELPALNILAVEEDVDIESLVGAAVGVPMLQDVTLSVVLQVVSRGGVAPSRQARSISAACEAAIALNPTLSGVCPQVIRVTGRQWLRDDAAEQRLARMNTRLVCGYRTQSTDPFTAL